MRSIRKALVLGAALLVTVTGMVVVAPSTASAQDFSCYRYDEDYNKVLGTCTVIPVVTTANLVMTLGGTYDHLITTRVYDPQNMVDSVDLTMYAADGSVAGTGYVYRFTTSGAYKTFTYNQRVYEGSDDAGRYTVVAEIGYDCCDGWRTDQPEPTSAPVAYSIQYRTQTLMWAGPVPVRAGQTLTMFGRVTLGRDRWGDEYYPRGGSVTFYFRRTGTKALVSQGTVRLTGAGVFVKKVTARAPGIWKVIYNGTPTTARSSAVRNVPLR